ncbi:MAG: tryptophan synthase subunit alpha, partial [Bacteroidota bacterium]
MTHDLRPTDRLRDAIAATTDRGEKAMGLFLTNGFPDPAATLPILRAIDDAGADFIELGMPFSDPLAEGLPIQEASERALSHGVTMADAFETARAFRAESETPLLLMGYTNPVLRYGAVRALGATAFPWATLSVNVVGSLALGWALSLSARDALSP